MKTILLALFLATQMCQALTLAWNRNPEPNITKYEVLWGDTPSTISGKLDAGNNIQLKIPDEILIEGKTYYFAVRAINDLGMFSSPSVPISVYIHKEENPDWAKIRHINVQMSIDGGVTYTSIGRVPYPKLTKQRYKTNIISPK
jgi:hypothetical protein